MSNVYGQSTQVDSGLTVNIPAGEGPIADGRTYFDTETGRLYLYTGSRWVYLPMTSTSTSTTTTSTSTTSSSSSSISTTSTSISTTSTSTTSTSSSTTLM